MKTGIELIAEERKEQIEKHGWTIQYDIYENPGNQLSFGAALLLCLNPKQYAREDNNFSCPEGWDIEKWKYMLSKSYKDRLIIAGALIAAEIDRLQNN